LLASKPRAGNLVNPDTPICIGTIDYISVPLHEQAGLSHWTEVRRRACRDGCL